MTSPGLLLTDFTPNSTYLGWYVVNDNVMGGRSEGDFDQKQGELIFTGRTNTIGGGFSSIRTKPVQLDLSGFAGIQLKLQGDGRRYTWPAYTRIRGCTPNTSGLLILLARDHGRGGQSFQNT